MQGWLIIVGALAQYLKAHQKIPNAAVVAGAIVASYVAYWWSNDAALAHGFKPFVNDGLPWVVTTLASIQGTSSLAGLVAGIGTKLNIPLLQSSSLLVPVTNSK